MMGIVTLFQFRVVKKNNSGNPAQAAAAEQQRRGAVKTAVCYASPSSTMSDTFEAVLAETGESEFALAPAAACKSQQYCSFVLRYASMVSALRMSQTFSSAFNHPTNFAQPVHVQLMYSMPVQRLSAIGGAAVVSIAMRLARVACGPFMKSILSGATRIARRCAAKQAAVTPEYLVWQGQCLYDDASFACAADSWQRAVDIGYPLAHALLANILIDGRPGLPQDLDRAFLLASTGARLGCAHSKGVLGRCYSGGYGTAQNIVDALELARQSAAAGSCYGKFVLGVCYEKGEGVEVDMSKAVRLWRLAADDGLAVAQFNLGVMLKTGKGAAHNLAEALRLWKSASSQGHAPAQTSLAYMFYCGDGADQDKAEAARLWRSAAEQGRAVAQFNLGHLLLAGDGVAEDAEEGFRWLQRAASQGNRHAKMELARLEQPVFVQPRQH
jgi:TPR repeat protein